MTIAAHIDEEGNRGVKRKSASTVHQESVSCCEQLHKLPKFSLSLSLSFEFSLKLPLNLPAVGSMTKRELSICQHKIPSR
jgi:hypothetical protein